MMMMMMKKRDFS